MTFEPIWEGIIAWYLFLAGLGGAAYASSTWLRLRHPENVNLIRYGRIIGPVTVCIGLVLLIFDATAGLHNPLRFIFLLTNFESVMTWGVVFLALFIVISLIVAALDVFGRAACVPKWLDVAGAILGLCVCIYTGCLLGVAKTFPLWNNALLPVLFLVSALSTGMAAILLVGIFGAPKEFDAVVKFKKFHFWLPVFEMFLVACLLFITASNAEAAGLASVMNLVAGDCSVLFWIVFVLIGLVVPTVMELYELFIAPKASEGDGDHGGHGGGGGSGHGGHGDGGGHMVSALSDAAILVGGFTLRLLVLIAALPITIVQPWV